MCDTFLQSQLAIFQYAKINYCNHIVRCLELCCFSFLFAVGNSTGRNHGDDQIITRSDRC